MNYISVIDRYHEYQNAIHELMASIVAGAFDEDFFNDNRLLKHSMSWLTKHYPFIDLMFTLNKEGIQTSENFYRNKLSNDELNKGQGIDRSYRPYYIKAKVNEGIVVTEPCLSSSSHNLCISTALKYKNKAGSVIGILVIDIDFAHASSF